MDLLRVEEFEAFYRLMEKSFPVDERRPAAAARALLEEPGYRVFVARDTDGSLLGFLATWTLGEWLFFEHLAVDPERRNAGIGGRLLRDVVASAGLRVCLEVELPTDTLKQRRIAFYERNGFFYNEQPYVQPPLFAGQGSVPLRLMTTGGALDGADFEALRRLLYTRVYRVNE